MKRKRLATLDEVVKTEVYEKAIREGLREQFPKRQVVKQKRNFSPSKIAFGGGKCPRYWYYNFEGGHEQVDTGDYKSQLKRLFGIVNHEALQGAINQEKYPSWVMEVQVTSEDPPIFGYVDILDREYNVPIEIKNTDAAKFRKAKDSNVAEESHLVQLLIYMRLLKARQGVLLYVNRETLEIHAFPIMLTQERKDYIDGLFKWMQQVREAYKNEQKPERPEGFSKDGWPCKWCPFKETCWSDEDQGDIKIVAAKELNTG